MTNKTVLFGTAHSLEKTSLNIVNMRLVKVTLPIENIAEIYYDTKE